jgi:hypothetical protein
MTGLSQQAWNHPTIAASIAVEARHA